MVSLGAEQRAQLFPVLSYRACTIRLTQMLKHSSQRERRNHLWNLPRVDLSVVCPDVLGIPESKIGSLSFLQLSSL